MKYLALGIFVLTYSLLLVLPKYRAYIAISSAVLFVILGILPINKVFTSVDWNVILMISGTMGVVYLFIESKMPAKLADLIIQKTPNVKWAIISLALFAGVISAFIDNVATVLMIAPVALNIAKKLKISPVPSIIVIAISSNLQGMATLVGDTTSILLGGYAGLDFLDFFWFNGKIGIFWVVEISALFSVLILLYIFRKNNEPVKVYEKTTVTNYIPTMLLISMIVLLISVSFITNKHAITNGIICMGVFLFGLVGHYIKNKQKNIFLKSLKEIDYFTLLLLTGLFVVIASISEVGIIND
ncbi:MAG: SLC13 family permease, partial [Clostridia bacterium]|nr:SLC13 family permease [Clostridia bacterium]